MGKKAKFKRWSDTDIGKYFLKTKFRSGIQTLAFENPFDKPTNRPWFFRRHFFTFTDFL